ncbi:MAG: zf-HC2 domain-containing protein, partial [Deltaproteobacteria bacterium]|nr:zf-HC2 domain-containing protein [Deltaproteobacteria bacterium]
MTEASTQPCPDDDALQAWVEGRLGRDERARVAAHLTTCAECRAVVGEDGVAGPSSEPTFAR